jgi:hypothetical protein
LGEALARGGKWQRAEAIANMMVESDEKVWLLREIARVLAANKEYEQLLSFVQRSWLQAKTREYCIRLLTLAVGLISLKPELGIAFSHAFTWVDDFLSA